MRSIKEMIGLSISENLEIQNNTKFLSEQKSFFYIEFDNWLKKFEFDIETSKHIFREDFYQAFVSGDLDEHFYTTMYHQALEWHKTGFSQNRVMLILSNCRQLFILLSEKIDNSLLARGLCHTVDLVQSVANSVFHLNQTLIQMRKKSESEANRMKRSFHLISANVPEDLIQAFIDHQNWKIRAFSAALGEIPEGDFPFSTSECRLGKWLDSGGQNTIPEKERKSFHNAHEKVHQLGFLALKEAKEHHPERIVDFLVEMELASDEVSRVLQERIEDEFVLAASLDTLTELPNRCAFDMQLTQNLAFSKRHDFWLGLIVIDIDFFKKINDQYGHAYGDQVLKAISKVLKQTLREEDHVFRWGGEEFAVLTIDKHASGVEMLAERLRLKVEAQAFKTDENYETPLTISLGCTAFHPKLEVLPNEIFAIADEQLYLAKEDGRNCVIARTLEAD